MESKKLYSAAPGSLDDDNENTQLDEDESLEDFDTEGDAFGFSKAIFNDFAPDKDELDGDESDDDDEDAAYLDTADKEDSDENEIEDFNIDTFDVEPDDSDENGF